MLNGNVARMDRRCSFALSATGGGRLPLGRKALRGKACRWRNLPPPPPRLPQLVEIHHEFVEVDELDHLPRLSTGNEPSLIGVARQQLGGLQRIAELTAGGLVVAVGRVG